MIVTFLIFPISPLPPVYEGEEEEEGGGGEKRDIISETCLIRSAWD